MGIPGPALSKPAFAQRIAVVGAVGCGKSTLAGVLARRWRLPHVELDAIYFGPNWEKASDQVFYDEVVRHAGGSEWVIDGNYEAVRDIVWVRAQVLLWLDYPLRIVLWLLSKRTLKRLLAGEVFASGNREHLRRLVGSQSILWWAIRSHGPRRRQFEQLLSGTRYAHLKVMRFHSPDEMTVWLEGTHD